MTNSVFRKISLTVFFLMTCLFGFLEDGLFVDSHVQAKPIISPGKKSVKPVVNQDFPTFEEVEEVVIKTLTVKGKYYENDLLTQSEAEKVISQIKRTGWKVPDSKKIVKRFLPQGDFLVRQLRSRNGFPFMRKISKMPQGFDRLDRMQYIPKGRKTISLLINSKGGEVMIEYMTTTKEGKNMGRLLSRARNGKNYNQATGKIYSSKQLLEELKTIHEQALVTAKVQAAKEKKKAELKQVEPLEEKTSEIEQVEEAQ